MTEGDEVIVRYKFGGLKQYPPGNDLLGGFNPFEKYKSNWIIYPCRGEKKYLKAPPSDHMSPSPKALLSQ